MSAQKPARPLEPLFSPRSVAVIGASHRRGSIGFSLVHNLVINEFAGAIFPVNPHAAAIHSLKCYPTITAIPDEIDLALIAVPQREVEEVLAACIAKPVRGVVVITAGYAETGPVGRERENRLRDMVRGAKIRTIGPNCMGIINTDEAVRLNATFAPTAARAGALGFVSQSGALGVAILNVAQDLGIGFTQFVSMGNKADVSANDLLEHWEDDPATGVIAMYLESFGNPRRFATITRRVSKKKPILVVKSGRTAEGARAATSHTGAIAGTDVTVSAFLERCGVLRADTIEELFDVARALARVPLPVGNRVGIVTNAGGPAIMATDACINLGLHVPELAQATQQLMREWLPAEASFVNPVDMIASADPQSYARTLEVVLDDPGIDMALVINVTPLLANPIDIAEEIGKVARSRSKPVLAVMMATEDFYEAVKDRHDLPPVYRFPESAARAFAMLLRYSEWKDRPVDPPTEPFIVDDAAVTGILERSASPHLSPADAFRVLEHYGIPVSRWGEATTAEEAVAAAERIGYPVVVKAMAPDLVHKSDVGGVRLDLRNRDDVEAAAREMSAKLSAGGHPPAGYLVQEMVRGGHEVIFGITTDPRFGPLLMFGLGGRYVEVFQDVRFGVLPLARTDALELIHGIRGAKLLTGVRGEPGVDIERLAEILLRLAQLAERHPRIRELDINPFLASSDRTTSLALDARIELTPEER
jgi:acetyl coenzyme A synthetase (ADP forming)-like protein